MRKALDHFSYLATCEIGGLTSALGGLENIVFTVVFGENASTILAETCALLAWLRVCLDSRTSFANAIRISPRDVRLDARDIATDDETTIAGHLKSLLSGAPT